MSILNKIFGDPNEKVVKELMPTVEKINELEKKFEAMSDEELRQMTIKFRERMGVETSPQPSPYKGEGENKGEKEKLDEILPEAFSVVREAAKRTLGQRHYDVQLLGGMVLHRGQIAEMKTGEGKTLVATLPVYLNALLGKGVHVVTVNDYLAKRDAEWMGQIYNFLGLSVGCINHEIAYVYSDGKDKNFQFSISNFQTNSNDSNSNDPADAEALAGKQNSNDQTKGSLVKVSRREAYQADITYGTNNEFGFDYLRDNMVGQVGQMSQRPLHYAIVDEVDSILIDEARTPLIISAPAEESTEKYYKFSQLVDRLEENTDYNIDEKMRAATLTEAGIAKMEKLLGVENIYAHGGLSDVHHIEQALKARVLFKRDRDYVVKEGEVIIVDEFTGRLMYGRRYSEGLHQAIEAKEGVNIQRESQTLATVTFQNYFRMYEKLAGMTGTAVTEAEEFSKIYKLETVVIPTNRPMIRKDLNDLIYKSEAGKLKAVAAEIKKRHETGQPILVGTISIEKNEMLGAMLEREGIQAQILNAKHHEKEAGIIAQAGRLGAVTVATNMAGRGVDIILGGSPADPEEQKKVIEAGGLHVIGTERHEARRIDNQLRGRSGRQGDPGSTQFYVSTDDDLMRIFGGDRMKSIMTTLRVPEDMPIENRLISKSIESAQMKVEGNNFDIRKHLVEYDDVINKHRETIYRRRREILEMEGKKTENDVILEGAERPIESRDAIATPAYRSGRLQHDRKILSEMILEMVENEIDQVVIFHTAAEEIKNWNIEEIYQVAGTIFPVDQKLKKDLSVLVEEGSKFDKVKARTTICEHLVELAKAAYEKLKLAAANAKIDWQQVEKAVLLRSIDMIWIEHLEAMDHMRRGIGLRGYGQRDPLVEYKKEAYRLYNELNNLIQKQVVYSIFKVGDLAQFNVGEEKKRPINYSAPAKTMEKGMPAMSSGQAASPQQKLAGKQSQTVDMVHEKVKDAAGDKVGRNDPCPCGSGKKFKKCCGK